MVSGTIDRWRDVESRRARLAAGGAAMGTTLDDAELGRRFRDGDPDALGELARRFSRPLLTVALRHLFDAELARDAVQQTFLQAWRAAGRFDVDRPLAPGCSRCAGSSASTAAGPAGPDQLSLPVGLAVEDELVVVG